MRFAKDLARPVRRAQDVAAVFPLFDTSCQLKVAVGRTEVRHDRHLYKLDAVCAGHSTPYSVRKPHLTDVIRPGPGCMVYVVQLDCGG